MTAPARSQPGNLDGVRVVEVADEQAEYCGLLLAGLGAEVIKVEPPAGSPTRRIGPFANDAGADLESSLYFWQYNRAKRSVVIDLDTADGVDQFRRLVASADVVLDSTRRGDLDDRNLGLDALRAADPALITARMTPFGDTGPWADYRASDLVHLALGGPMMNCGYDPLPGRPYHLPPIAPQMWHAFHIAGEQLAMMLTGALVHRQLTGAGQALTCAVHEAVAKSTEIDLPSWIMRAAPLSRQTCRHAAETVTPVPSLLRTQDGRWLTSILMSMADAGKLVAFLDRYGLGTALGEELERLRSESSAASSSARNVPGTGNDNEFLHHCQEALQRLFGKSTYENAPWREAQEAGVLVAPLRRPHENALDEHWQARATFATVEHPERGESYLYPTSKWVSSATSWQVGRRAPLLGEDTATYLGPSAPARVRERIPTSPGAARRTWALEGVRVLDFSWFLASAGGTRFLAAMGAECLKVEWKANPDTRLGAMAPVGGRLARDAATGPLAGVSDPDMGGNFHHKNAGKRGISLNVLDPRGLDIARRLVAMSDVVAEGFSPGVLDRWGLGYEVLRELKPDIIYAQQSGMGSAGTYGRFRTVGPIAAAFAGTSEMSGLPEPAMPAGWGYSYLDWLGAYSFCLAITSAIHHRNATGEGQWIDASQCEAGIFAGGTSVLDWSVTGNEWRRVGNDPQYQRACPNGVFRTRGDDAWLAITCRTEDEWAALCHVAGHPEWRADPRLATLDDRLAHRELVASAVGDWLADEDGRTVMTALQAGGVAAGVCQTAADRCNRDPQLAHLDWLRELPGKKIGTWPVPDVPVRMSETPAVVGGPLGRGAPIYGEDNEYVYGELLGMSNGEIADLAADGVI